MAKRLCEEPQEEASYLQTQEQSPGGRSAPQSSRGTTQSTPRLQSPNLKTRTICLSLKLPSSWYFLRANLANERTSQGSREKKGQRALSAGQQREESGGLTGRMQLPRAIVGGRRGQLAWQTVEGRREILSSSFSLRAACDFAFPELPKSVSTSRCQ